MPDSGIVADIDGAGTADCYSDSLRRLIGKSRYSCVYYKNVADAVEAMSRGEQKNDKTFLSPVAGLPVRRNRIARRG